MDGACYDDHDRLVDLLRLGADEVLGRVLESSIFTRYVDAVEHLEIVRTVEVGQQFEHGTLDTAIVSE